MTHLDRIITLFILACLALPASGSCGEAQPTTVEASCEAQPTTGLKFLWSVDFDFVFDNREGDVAGTIFQVQLAPEVGIGYGDHSIKAGVVYNQPIGNEWRGHRLSPTAYYGYRLGQKEGWSTALGMFGRDNLVRPMPDYIYSDSTRYTQRNIRGAMLQWRGTRERYAEAVLDWRQLQDDIRREAFEIIARGEWVSPNSRWLAGGLLMMNHLARSANAGPEQHVVDNFIANPYVGIDMRRTWPAMSEASLRVGTLAGLTRDRGDSDWLSAAGLWLDVNAEWHGLGVHDNLYAGGRFFPLCERYGTLLNEGEKYYASKFYNRTDLYYKIFARGPVDLRASLDLHATKEQFAFYQRVLLRVRF